MWKCEASTIEPPKSAVLQGALCAREYLADAAISDLVTGLYARSHGPGTQCGHYRAAGGRTWFIPHRWGQLTAMLGLISWASCSGKALPPRRGMAWQCGPIVSMRTHLIQCPPSSWSKTHQFSHAMVRFPRTPGDYADYWQNSVERPGSAPGLCGSCMRFSRWVARALGFDFCR